MDLQDQHNMQASGAFSCRLELEVLVPLPDAPARKSILRHLTAGLPLDESVDIER